MTTRTRRCCVALSIGVLLSVGAWNAADARIHSLGGNARLQIGNGLPLPIGFTAAPGGLIQALSGATLRPHGVHAASHPAKLVLDPSQLTHPGTAMVLVVALGNSFQVKTAIPIQFPKSKVMFSEGGRTGAATVTFCPGDVVTRNGNPGCASGSAGTIPGRLTYTKTSHQFGGPAFFAVQGVADVAIPAGASAPCAFVTNPFCLVLFANANPNSMPAQGAPFGFSSMAAGAGPSPGLFGATVTAAGLIVALTPTGMGPGLANPATSFGGPWTTGMLRIEQPAAFGFAETFTLTGSDARATSVIPSPSSSSQTPNGTGGLSLVAGAVSDRSVSGPNANRGWLNLTVGPRLSHVPLLPEYGIAALLGLMALSGAYLLRRRGLRLRRGR